MFEIVLLVFILTVSVVLLILTILCMIIMDGLEKKNLKKEEWKMGYRKK